MFEKYILCSINIFFVWAQYSVLENIILFKLHIEYQYYATLSFHECCKILGYNDRGGYKKLITQTLLDQYKYAAAITTKDHETTKALHTIYPFSKSVKLWKFMLYYEGGFKPPKNLVGNVFFVTKRLVGRISNLNGQKVYEVYFCIYDWSMVPL